jgi:hypothetical protein
VYAGAAREAVFSVPAVVRRVKADFVPLALRATLVNRPQDVRDKDEQWLYQRIARAKLAPQGICVLDSRGQVLAWTQMFDDDKSVLDFLDHTLRRFRQTAGRKGTLVTERYLHFPSERVEDWRDNVQLPAFVPEAHAKGRTCPGKEAKGRIPPGTMLVRLVGRALDPKGRPLADVVRQEHYVEDQFTLTPQARSAVAKTLTDAGGRRVRLPDDVSKLLASHAHLGHIDVQPCLCMIKDRAENKGEWKRCELWARKVDQGTQSPLWRVEGQSEVVSEVTINGQGVHNVKLAWEGFIELKGLQMTRLVLSGHGQEKLQFAKDDHPLKHVRKDEVAFLPGGRPIDLDGGVRYGIIAEPGPDVDAATAADATRDAVQPIPDEARQQLVEALGGAFIVFRDKVQVELKLSAEQKEKLLDKLPEYVQETMKAFEDVQDLKPQQRERRMQEHRQKSDRKLSDFLKDLIDAKQQKRLFQVQLQQAGVFALLGENEAFLDLQITADQKKKFMEVVHEMQEKIQALVKEAENGGNPEEIRPRAMKTQRAYRGRIEALLTEGQRSRWRKLLGRPFKLDD